VTLETLLDVVNVPVADRPRHALAVAIGIQTDVLVCDIELDVVRLVHGGRYTQELAVQRLA
jgi:hypothetical protein